MVKPVTHNIVRHKRPYRARVKEREYAKNPKHRTALEKADALAEELALFDKPRAKGYNHRQRSEISLAHFSIQDKPFVEIKK